MTYQDIIQDKPPALIDIANTLRAMAFQLHPDIEENAYGGKVVRMTLYSIGHKNNPIMGIAIGKDHCQLFLHHTDQVDTKHLPLTGKGKHAKHIKFRAHPAFDKLLTAKVTVDRLVCWK
ncbi:MAG: hypothetical protein AAGD05_17185 [Bacteroidota bacterium]